MRKNALLILGEFVVLFGVYIGSSMLVGLFIAKPPIPQLLGILILSLSMLGIGIIYQIEVINSISDR